MVQYSCVSPSIFARVSRIDQLSIQSESCDSQNGAAHGTTPKHNNKSKFYHFNERILVWMQNQQCNYFKPTYMHSLMCLNRSSVVYFCQNWTGKLINYCHGQNHTLSVSADLTGRGVRGSDI